MSCSEFELIERYFKAHQANRPDVVLGVGDDCALLAPAEDQLIAVSTDTLVSGVHFFADMPPEDLGYKAVVANLSDLAAMGASPSWMSLALTLPEVDESWLEGFSAGLFKAADYYGIQLVGGDTTRGPLSLTITVQGQVPKNKQLIRSGAKPGDWIYVTGPLGGAALALEVLYGRVEADAPQTELLLQSFYRPTPRLLAGQALRSLASAAIDISDGLATDLGHLASRSGCRAVVDLAQLPMHPLLGELVDGDRALRLALAGGEDYELCFTVPMESRGVLETTLAHTGAKHLCIGQMQGGEGVDFCRDDQVIDLAFKGYEHF